MPKKPDSGRTILDILILTAIGKAGLESVYGLQKELKLSGGAVLPSLSRLKKRGLIRAKAAGTRNKQVLVLTGRGRVELETKWLQAVDAVMPEINRRGPKVTDLTTLVRAAWLIWFLDSTKVQSFLTAQADFRKMAASACEHAVNTQPIPLQPLRTYLYLSLAVEAQQLAAEASVLEKLRDKFRTIEEEQLHIKQLENRGLGSAFDG